ncbi:hypothetical protein C2R22_00220 [Salinigranum rubrum]|uniref:SHOCT domain-containing protein n=1 Tax=Salinigranum rubrum TaxID=755307 RepID=A0A2I8VEE9_9EURY|nr:hypothetical protein [Salinigranum rubrum]AUV80281.1 hypothetical protein C2R22_00220 [Salinigranum rubrum]
MDSEVTHPRTLALFRAVLYLATFVAALGLVGVGLSVLGAAFVLAGVSLFLTGDANALGLALLAGTGLVTTVGLAVGVAFGARRVDRRVTDADRRPDPVEELTRQYVAGAIDERTFERRVERVLTGDATDDRRLVRRALGSVRARFDPRARLPFRGRLGRSRRGRQRRRDGEREPDPEPELL